MTAEFREETDLMPIGGDEYLLVGDIRRCRDLLKVCDGNLEECERRLRAEDPAAMELLNFRHGDVRAALDLLKEVRSLLELCAPYFRTEPQGHVIGG